MPPFIHGRELQIAARVFFDYYLPPPAAFPFGTGIAADAHIFGSIQRFCHTEQTWSRCACDSDRVVAFRNGHCGRCTHIWQHTVILPYRTDMEPMCVRFGSCCRRIDRILCQKRYPSKTVGDAFCFRRLGVGEVSGAAGACDAWIFDGVLRLGSRQSVRFDRRA